MREIFSRHFLVILMSIASIFTYFWLENVFFSEIPVSDRIKKHVPQDRVLDVKLNLFDSSGRLQYQLDAPEMIRYLDNKITAITDPCLKFLSGDVFIGKVIAKKGEINADGSMIDLFDRAELIRFSEKANERIYVTSNYFKLSVSDQVVSSNQRVRLLSGQLIMNADGLLYKHKTGDLELFGGVRGMFCNTQKKHDPQSLSK